MEPLSSLSLAANVASIVSASRKILSSFYPYGSSYETLGDEILVFQVHIGILEEIGQLVLESRSELPPAAQSCAQLCQKRLNRVESILPKRLGTLIDSKKRSILKEMEAETLEKALCQPMAEFSGSVQLYREVVMDSITHSLLREQMDLQHSMAGMLKDQIMDHQHMQDIIDSQFSAHQKLHKDYLTQVADLKQFAVQGFAQNSEKPGAGLDDLLSKMQFSERKLNENEGRVTDTSHLAEKLREVAAKHQRSEQLLKEEARMSSPLPVSRQPAVSDRDRFTFSATIVGDRDGEVEHVVARAKMDTGCVDNWVSEELLIRAGLVGSLQPVASSDTFLGFGGAAFEPLGTMEITWFGVNTAKSWKNVFLVHRDGPFDMVLGETWITEDSLLTLSQPALALRMTDFTKEERLLIEMNAKSKGATADQISSLRRAEEAAARERKRQNKAASLGVKPSPPGLPTMLSSNLLTSQSSDPGSSRQPSQLSTSSRTSTVETED
ncbi:MAG: hypothetical protein Q9226_008586 [Calogaya cf. arnoldii]